MFTNIYAKSKTFTPVSCKNTDIYPSASETKFRIGIAGVEVSEREGVGWTGTIDNPITDMDIIIQTVTEFAQKQENNLSGRTGWLHIKSRLSIPEEMRGNGYRSASTGNILPMEVLVPVDPIFETWFYVNETGEYSQAMGLVSSQDGIIHQQTVLIDDQWISLTLL